MLDWTGAWSWVSGDYEGSLILTERYFCEVSACRDRCGPKEKQPTEIETANWFKSYEAKAGTLNLIKDGEETLIEMVSSIAHHPANVSGRELKAIEVDSDLMSVVEIDQYGTRSRSVSYNRLSDIGQTPLAGAWKCDPQEFDGMMIMTDTQFIYISTAIERPQIMDLGSDLSDIDAVTLAQALHSLAGTYTTNGSVMTRQTVLAMNPSRKGSKSNLEFDLKYDLLTLRAASIALNWRKL